MSENPKETNDRPAAEAPVCEPVCEKLPDSAQPATPSDANGRPDGRQARPEPGAADALPVAPAAALGQPDAPPAAVQPLAGLPDAPAAVQLLAPSPAALQAALVGEPDAATDLRWCKVCKALVHAIGKGKCERCNAFLKLNFSARKHPVNKTRREQILSDLLTQFPPANILARATCERLAGVMEQLEVLKPGSTEWQRLVQTEQALSASLHDSRLSREPLASADYSTLNDEEMIQKTTAILKHLLELHAAPRVSDAPARRAAGPLVQAETEPCEERSAPTAVLAPEPICIYCAQSPSRCDAIRASRPEAWQALHWLDPIEVARRRQEREEDAEDEMVFRMTGWPSSRAIAKQRALEPAETPEQQQQAEVRRRLGWDAGTIKV